MKCSWCNKEISKEEEIKVNIDFNDLYMCCEKCKENYEDYYKYAMKNQGKFIILALVGSIVIVPFAILASVYNKMSLLEIGGGVECIWLGLTMIKFPFATGYSTRQMGAKRAKKSVGKLGKILLVIGIILLIFGGAVLLV
ncbi:MAG: hypothetical protein ACRDAU_09940 [Clostridium sp.]